MATITVRALDPATWEPLQGNGQNNFISDTEAVAQIIATRLKLFQGEWWENLLDGLPMFQKILGSEGTQRNMQVVIELISRRITETVHVVSISSFTATFQNRRFGFRATVETEFGTVFLTTNPAPTG
jgi:hypothetical protein